jgi:hypothetical protein
MFFLPLGRNSAATESQIESFTVNFFDADYLRRMHNLRNIMEIRNVRWAFCAFSGCSFLKYLKIKRKMA